VPLLENIFFKNAPLHDGAAIVMNNRVVAAKCILPVTQSPVPKSYGTRHRAAIGITETSDAIVVVVSEETGGISVAFGGKIERNIAPQNLSQTISKYFVKTDNKKETR
jgi:DNA integrity scanning protein DisA with diadenylate cyclase activity